MREWSVVSRQSSVVCGEWAAAEFDTGHRRRAAATWSRDCASPYPATDDWPLTTDASPLTTHHSPSGITAASPGAGRSAGDAAEHGAVGEARAARIVEIEDAANHLARGVQTGDRRAVGIDDACAGVDLDAAEGEGEAAGDGIGLERRLLDGDGPV